MDAPIYFTIEVERSLINAQGGSVWFRLTFRSEWIPERQLWREELVKSERISS